MTKAKILIVEDNLIEAEDIAGYLSERGFRILSIVESGEDAIQSVEKHRPDIVILDIELKGKIDNGLIAGRNILKTYDVPVIFLTRLTNDQTRNMAKEITPFSYLAKPFIGPNLEEKIEEVLQRQTHVANQQRPILYFDNGRHIRLDINEILFFKGGSVMSTELYKTTSRGKMVLSLPLKHILDQFTGHSNIIRCHRSYVVNIQHLESLENKTAIRLSGVEDSIPIGRRYRNGFLSQLNILRKKIS